MKEVKGQQANIQWHKAILTMSFFLGAIVRIFPGVITGFPLNDGGMFYIMIRDLRLNHYLLPLTTSYNNAGIPFTYPPLGFYLTALLRDAFYIRVLESLRWLPVVTNLISIFAFYLLASALLEDKTRGAIASVVYALSPGSYDWFIMGGGLTRSLGSLFILLTLYFLLRTFQLKTWKDTFLAILFYSLAVLSHPEYALHILSPGLLLWIFYSRNWDGLLRAAFIGFGASLLTSPWWATLLADHGMGPVISAFHAGMYQRNPFIEWVQALFNPGSYLPFLIIFRLLGIGWAAWKRHFLLLTWTLLPFVVEPRSAPAIVFYPIAMLTALGLTDALPYIINLLRKNPSVDVIQIPFTERRWFNGVVFFLMLSLFMESAVLSFRLVNTSLNSSSREVFDWAKQNTPTDAHFLIITGTEDSMVDPTQEWFPALTERRSQTTLQGLEWTLAEGFTPRLALLENLQTCKSTECIEDWSVKSGLDFDYLLVEKETASKSLLESLSRSNLKLIHENDEFQVYEKSKPPEATPNG